MSAWGLLLVPVALGSVALLLVLTARLETWVLSPRALILSAARSRRAAPGHVEALVAQQCVVLLAAIDTGERDPVNHAVEGGS